MIQVLFYSRKDCHLCDQVRSDLQSLQGEIPHDLNEIDIDSDPKLLKKYGLEIPVVVAGPYTVKAPIGKQDLEITLKAAQYRENQITSIDQAITAGEIQIPVNFTRSDRISHWLSRHYLALFNLFVTFYLGLAFLAPVMMEVGWTAPAGLIYRVYGMMCHQLAFRSFFLFGEQLVYPRSTIQGLMDCIMSRQLDYLKMIFGVPGSFEELHKLDIRLPCANVMWRFTWGSSHLACFSQQFAER